VPEAPRVVLEGVAVSLERGNPVHEMHVSTLKRAFAVQGYLAYKKTLPPRTLQWAYFQGPTVALGGGVVSYERGHPVVLSLYLRVQGYLAHTQMPIPAGPPQDSRHRPTVGS